MLGFLRADPPPLQEGPELQQVGAVGLERVARQAPLELQVGQEVEHQLLDPGLLGDGSGVRKAHGLVLRLGHAGSLALQRGVHPLASAYVVSFVCQ